METVHMKFLWITKIRNLMESLKIPRANAKLTENKKLQES